MDEMRYGLMSNIRRSWSKKGERTVVLQQQEFVNRYLYSAIDPINGDSFHLMNMNDVNAKNIDIFLNELQKEFPNNHLLIIWDNAPFHKSSYLKRKNMTLAFLPSYSPQLNPIERFFEEIRKITANRIFKDGIDELSKILEEGTVKLKEDKSAIKSLTAYDWIIEQWEWIFGKVQN